MISRVAENAFWLSRYLERAENTARVLEVNQTLLLDFDVPLEQQWQPLLIICGIHSFPEAADGEAVQTHLSWDGDNPCSIVSSVRFARENARTIREVISGEMWAELNRVHLWLQGAEARQLYDGGRSEFYARIHNVSAYFSGVTDGTMAHGEAWEFLQLGKYLERASQTARILDVKYHMLRPTPERLATPVDNAHWTAILKSCSGYEAFHKTKHATVDPGTAVPAFLLFDSTFPRSVRYCLQAVLEAAHAISGRPLRESGNEVERAVQELVGWLHLIKIDDILLAGLHEVITNIVDRIHAIGNAIHRTWFDVRVQLPASLSSSPYVVRSP